MTEILYLCEDEKDPKKNVEQKRKREGTS